MVVAIEHELPDKLLDTAQVLLQSKSTSFSALISTSITAAGTRGW
jgi:hypothetical protein